MDFWADKDDKFKKKMVEVYKEQMEDLDNLVPNFTIANATIHFDESSPHLHIVGVPFKDGMKNGMERQVGKSDVFTKDSLKNIQDKMREYCINSFNRIYNLNYTITTILEKYEDDLKNHTNEVKNLQKKIKTRDEKIEDLKYDLENANDTIDELEDKVSKLEEALSYFKELWRKFIEFLQDKFFSTNKYDDFINDLYNEDILDNNDIEIIENNSKSKNKDDFER